MGIISRVFGEQPLGGRVLFEKRFRCCHNDETVKPNLFGWKTLLQPPAEICGEQRNGRPSTDIGGFLP